MKRIFFKPVVILSFVLFTSAVVMFLWNAIIPDVIGWGSLSYLQAVGLLSLCRLLFGNFPSIKQRARQFITRREEIKEQVKDMSREQRREFIRNYRRNINKNEQ